MKQMNEQKEMKRGYMKPASKTIKIDSASHLLQASQIPGGIPGSDPE